MTETVQLSSPVERVDFTRLEKAGSDKLNLIVQDYGTVYVTSITRDGCSGCIEQKPLYQQLAQKLTEAHPGTVRFSNVHIQYQDGDMKQSEEAKRLLGHGSYPTYMVHVKSRFGPLEHYRAAYPKMEELERQVKDAFELAEHYKKDFEKNH